MDKHSEKNISIDDIYKASKIDKWFLTRIKEIIQMEINLSGNKHPLSKNDLLEFKLAGFSDSKIAKMLSVKKIKFIILEKNIK